jgi:choline monooxygenase
MGDLGNSNLDKVIRFITEHDKGQQHSDMTVASYFDPDIFAREMRLLANGPGYVGHQLMAPNQGDYFALPADREGRVLVRDANGINCLSNVCRHRQALMLNGQGNTESIVCPLHRWTYDLSGKLLGAPHFAENPCLNLENFRLQEWKGLLFEGPRNIAADLGKMQTGVEFDFSGYKLDHVEVHECDYNWKSFIEVYLEDYHVEPSHPGLGHFVNCGDLRWEFGDHYSVQMVGVNQGLQKAGSPVYQRWHEQVLKYRKGKPPAHGAIWLTYYPNLMVEWYPHVLVVSSLLPRGPRQTTNIVEFYYPEEICLFERDFIEAERAAYMETCHEDDELARRMDAGRERLLARGVNEQGPYQDPLEIGMRHFHQWYKKSMATI